MAVSYTCTEKGWEYCGWLRLVDPVLLLGPEIVNIIVISLFLLPYFYCKTLDDLFNFTTIKNAFESMSKIDSVRLFCLMMSTVHPCTVR